MMLRNSIRKIKIVFSQSLKENQISPWIPLSTIISAKIVYQDLVSFSLKDKT